MSVLRVELLAKLQRGVIEAGRRRDTFRLDARQAGYVGRPGDMSVRVHEVC